MQSGAKSRQWRVLYGQIRSDFHDGRAVLEMWHLDFAWQMRASTHERPMAMLWRPELVHVDIWDYTLRGLERQGKGDTARWTLQVWNITPTTRDDAIESMRQDQQRKPREIPSIYPPGPPPPDPDNPFA